MGDSSHFLDNSHPLSGPTVGALERAARNWVPGHGVPLDVPMMDGTSDEASGETRLHVPCVSAGVDEHGAIPGKVIASAFRFFDELAAR